MHAHIHRKLFNLRRANLTLNISFQGSVRFFRLKVLLPYIYTVNRNFRSHSCLALPGIVLQMTPKK